MSEELQSSSSRAQDTLQLIDSAGMSEEDKKDILSEIDQVVEENKIPVTEELFTLKPKKKGNVFPLVLNIIMLLAVAGGVYFAFQYYNTRQENLSIETQQYFSTEGKLIEELKKESETKLRKKDEEISKIQNELVELDRQSEELRNSMDEKIKVREEELRSALEDELQRERERLQALGASQEDIEAQLQDFEDQLQNEFNQELQAFREQSSQEIQAKEEELVQARELTREILEKANREKLDLEAETQRREAELRSQFEEEKAALESQTSEAQQRLEELSEQRRREDLVTDQIIGSYQALIDKIELGDITGAENDLDKLETLLMDQKITSLPSIAKRRDIDLFILDSLRENVETKTGPQVSETSSLVEAANMMLAAREIVSRGEAAFNEGDIDDARRLYLKALQEIPSLNRAYLGLSGIESQKRAAEISSGVAEGETRLLQGDIQEAVVQFRTAALSGDPGNEELVGQAVDGIQKALGVREEGLLSVKDRTIDNLEKQIDKKNKDLRIAEQNSEKQEREIQELIADKRSLNENISELNEQIDTLDENFKETIKETGREKEMLLSEIEEKNERVESLQETLRIAQVNALEFENEKKDIEQDLNVLRSKYTEAKEKAADLINTDSPENHEQAKNILYSVFNDRATQSLFPGVTSTLEELSIAQIADQRFAAELTGRESALKDILRFVDYLDGLTPARRAGVEIEVFGFDDKDRLMKTTIEGIQELASTTIPVGEEEYYAVTMKLLGTVSSATAGRVLIERLVQIDVKKGEIITIKRKSIPDGELTVARGKIVQVDDGKISAELIDLDLMEEQPMVMDLVYLEVSD